jgi:chitin synthase
MELVRLKELTGFFIFSIRFVVLMDLISTVLAPAGFLYFVYLFVVLFTEENNGIPLLSIVLFIAIYGLQVLLFLIKRQWQHLGWMVLYVLAMPLYFMVLPIYAFWHFDDFNWGSTRQVEDDDEDYVLKPEDVFDPRTIPLKTWAKYTTEDLPWRIQVEESPDPDY